MNDTAICISWISFEGCNDQIVNRMELMFRISLALTIFATVIMIISIIRRCCLIAAHNELFKVLAPQLIIASVLQLFFLVIRSSSRTNLGVPNVLLSITNLMSSMLLGNTILELITSWAQVYEISISLKRRSYQLHYWIIIGVLNLLVLVTTALTGVNSVLYFIWMRVTLSIWIVYLTVCYITLIYVGLQIYNMLRTSPSRETESTQRTIKMIPIILIVLCGGIFIPVTANFTFYTVYIKNLEQSQWLPVFEWYLYKIGSACYISFWAIYFWLNTTAYVNSERRSSLSNNKSSDKSTGVLVSIPASV